MRAQIGDKIKDVISGAEGIVVARTEWMYGCIRLTCSPQTLKDGVPAANFTVDEPQAIVLEHGAVPNTIGEPDQAEPARTHGERPEAPRREL